jgi:SAM-dependent methyltransferase
MMVGGRTTIPGADDPALRVWLDAEAAAPFSGWDFSRLAGRLHEDPAPWDYRAIVRAAFSGCGSLIDIGTGGGEMLSILTPLPPHTWATEGYPPNWSVARARLAPLGVQVVAVGDSDPSPLPFATESADLIINRHTSYDPAEIWRVLRPGGRFITQQVGGSHDRELNRLLVAPNPDNGFGFWTRDYARAQLAAAGFAIGRAEQAFPARRFADAGALAYYLRAVVGQIPDFDVARYFPRLREAQRHCEREGGIASRAHYFLIVAQKGQT